MRYFSSTSDTSDTCDTSDTSNTTHSRDASKASASVTRLSSYLQNIFSSNISLRDLMILSMTLRKRAFWQSWPPWMLHNVLARGSFLLELMKWRKYQQGIPLTSYEDLFIQSFPCDPSSCLLIEKEPISQVPRTHSQEMTDDRQGTCIWTYQLIITGLN